MSSDPGSADTTTDTFEVGDEERTWGILIHAGGFAGLAVPFGNVLAPLVAWLVKRDESRFVDENGIRALNFQLTWSVILLATALSILVGVGLVLFPLAMLVWLILTVVGTVKAADEEVYDYPLTIGFVD